MISVRRFLFALALALSIALPVSAAQGAPLRSSHAVCVPVNATGAGNDLGGGKTEATISSHGIVLGHTSASFMPTGVVETTESFTGPITFTSRVGTLTAQVAGTFDASGVFQATSTSITGTGLLRRVTGQVALAGKEDLATLTFTERITGTLCFG